MRKYDYQQIGFVLSSLSTVVAIHLIVPVMILVQAGTLMI